MRLGVGIIVLAALGSVGLWMSGTIGNEVSTGAKVGAGVGAIVLVFVCWSMAAQSVAQAIDGYAGLGTLVKWQPEIGKC